MPQDEAVRIANDSTYGLAAGVWTRDTAHQRLETNKPTARNTGHTRPSRNTRAIHYRDNTGLEADAIIERADGRWIAAEIKLNTGPNAIDRAAKALLRLRDKTTPQRAASLAALVVITPTGAAYRRPDGVQVAPITALGP